jgi:hypothetical protein
MESNNMSNWLIIKNNVVVDMIVADSIDYVKSNFDGEVIEDNGYAGIGWTNIDGSWKSQYPSDGKDYLWNEDLKIWELVFSEEEESVVK